MHITIVILVLDYARINNFDRESVVSGKETDFMVITSRPSAVFSQEVGRNGVFLFTYIVQVYM